MNSYMKERKIGSKHGTYMNNIAKKVNQGLVVLEEKDKRVFIYVFICKEIPFNYDLCRGGIMY